MKGVNFTVKKGQIFSLLGSNGAGKTPLLLIIKAKKTYSEDVNIKVENNMDTKTYEFDAVIKIPDDGIGAYIVFPYDIREEFGKNRISVSATFDSEPYQGSIVNMGVMNPDGTICYIIGIRKDIRAKIGKQAGDTVRVTIKEKAR